MLKQRLKIIYEFLQVKIMNCFFAGNISVAGVLNVPMCQLCLPSEVCHLRVKYENNLLKEIKAMYNLYDPPILPTLFFILRISKLIELSS